MSDFGEEPQSSHVPLGDSRSIERQHKYLQLQSSIGPLISWSIQGVYYRLMVAVLHSGQWVFWEKTMLSG